MSQEFARHQLSAKELLFYAEILEAASEVMSRRTCDDISDTAYKLFTDAEKQRMADAYQHWNSGGREEAHFHGVNWIWVAYLAGQFRELGEQGATLVMTL